MQMIGCANDMTQLVVQGMAAQINKSKEIHKIYRQ